MTTPSRAQKPWAFVYAAALVLAIGLPSYLIFGTARARKPAAYLCTVSDTGERLLQRKTGSKLVRVVAARELAVLEKKLAGEQAQLSKLTRTLSVLQGKPRPSARAIAAVQARIAERNERSAEISVRRDAVQNCTSDRADTTLRAAAQCGESVRCTSPGATCETTLTNRTGATLKTTYKCLRCDNHSSKPQYTMVSSLWEDPGLICGVKTTVFSEAISQTYKTGTFPGGGISCSDDRRDLKVITLSEVQQKSINCPCPSSSSAASSSTSRSSTNSSSSASISTSSSSTASCPILLACMQNKTIKETFSKSGYTFGENGWQIPPGGSNVYQAERLTVTAPTSKEECPNPTRTMGSPTCLLSGDSEIFPEVTCS